MTDTLEISRLRNAPEWLEARATSRITRILGMEFRKVESTNDVRTDVGVRLARLELLIKEGIVQPQDMGTAEQRPDAILTNVLSAVEGIRGKRQLALDYRRNVLVNRLWHPENPDYARKVFTAFSATKTLIRHSVVSSEELGLSDRFDYFARRAWIDDVIVPAQDERLRQYQDEWLSGIKHYFRHNPDDRPEDYGYSTADFQRLGALDKDSLPVSAK